MNDEENKSNLHGLERVDGASRQSDGVNEKKENLEENQQFLQQYGSPEGVTELEERARLAQTTLDEWNAANPLSKEYLDAVDTWKRGWDPVFSDDAVAANLAQQGMKGLEMSLGIQYSDIENCRLLSTDELKKQGYTDEQIKQLQILKEGRNLRYALEARKTDVTYIKNLMRRKK